MMQKLTQVRRRAGGGRARSGKWNLQGFCTVAAKYHDNGKSAPPEPGKYYGDSVALDFTVRSGPIHLKLLKNK